jgi:aminopeptidase
MLNRYAYLLTNYCLSLKKGEKVLIRSTTLAEPLIREIYRETLKLGAFPHIQLEMRDQAFIQATEASEEYLAYVDPLYKMAVEQFDAYLYVDAPFNLRENIPTRTISPELAIERKAISKLYMQRTGNRNLKRSLCNYPTLAGAQEAGMSLEEYEKFVFTACKLYAEDPIAAWLEVRKNQQHIVDYLNKCEQIQYKGEGIDIQFSTKGRTWINSDGQTNMPSGEVYTAPVEDSVQGVVHFTHPVVFKGDLVEGITLWVEDGYIQKWEAKRGVEMLDEVFKIPGARRFGEAAVGTNFEINRFTKNILFDEKIGGTIHMAIGQSYAQCGGKNDSAIHWDMIADMTNGGYILADGVKIYENGRFLI